MMPKGENERDYSTRPEMDKYARLQEIQIRLQGGASPENINFIIDHSGGHKSLDKNILPNASKPNYKQSKKH